MPDFQHNCSVIGAGVIGLLTAWELQKKGFQVTVYDQAEAFSGSSWAGGGIISPVPPWQYPEAVQQLVVRSLELYPSLLAEIQQASGIDSEYVQNGLLYCGPFDERSEKWRLRMQAEIELGSLSDWLTGSPDIPVWRFRHAAQLRNPRFGQALIKAATAAGVSIHQHAPIKRLQLKGNKLTGLLLESDQLIKTDQVVLAAGAWSDVILANSHLPLLGVKPVRGQMLLWKGPPGLLPLMVSGHGKYLIPRNDGLILGGSTVEAVGFDTSSTTAAEAEIALACRELFPPVDSLPLVRQWSGLRPAIDREIPVIGDMPGIRGLWLNTGHYRNGLGMAPASVKLLVGMMTGSYSRIGCQAYAMPAVSQARSIA